MSKKLTAKEVQQKIDLKNPNRKILLDIFTYVNTQIKCRFIDEKYGEFWAKPNNLLYRGDGHPILANIKRKNTKRENLKEKKFGRLLVLNHIDKNNRVYWICLCECGNEKIVSAKELKRGTTRSCGCLRSELNSQRFFDIEKRDQIIIKRKETMLKKYGVEYPIQNKEIKENTKKIWIEKYGVDNPSKNKEIQYKIEQTCFKNFGVFYPSQDREIALKQAKKLKNVYIVRHWKDNREVICRASYEYRVALNFNKLKEDYEKEIPFQMPDGKYYFVDFWLPNKNLYIEVKGYKRSRAMEKWNWFHKEHPNSELWDQKRLKELNIL